MKKSNLYGNLAKYYDLLYAGKDYKSEVKHIIQAIHRYQKSTGDELLDLACGTGEHLKYLKKDFRCTGVDLNQGMLEIAKKKLPRLKFQQANLTSFDVKQQFDVITCLFGSIGYLTSYAHILRALKRIMVHLKPGGVVLIEPWLRASEYRAGNTHLKSYEGTETKVVRLSISKRKGVHSILEMHYLIAERGRDIQYETDQHKMLLFDPKRFLPLLKNVGLKVQYVKHASIRGGLMVGVKP